MRDKFLQGINPGSMNHYLTDGPTVYCNLLKGGFHFIF